MTDWLGIDKLILLRKKRQTETCLFYGFVAAQEVIVSATREPIWVLRTHLSSKNSSVLSIILFDLQPVVSRDHQNSACALGDLWCTNHLVYSFLQSVWPTLLEKYEQTSQDFKRIPLENTDKNTLNKLHYSPIRCRKGRQTKTKIAFF